MSYLKCSSVSTRRGQFSYSRRQLSYLRRQLSYDIPKVVAYLGTAACFAKRTSTPPNAPWQCQGDLRSSNLCVQFRFIICKTGWAWNYMYYSRHRFIICYSVIVRLLRLTQPQGNCPAQQSPKWGYLVVSYTLNEGRCDPLAVSGRQYAIQSIWTHNTVPQLADKSDI